MKKIEVQEGQINISVQGIQDFDTLEKLALERANIIKETVIDENNYKDVEKELNELLDPAKKIRTYAAKFKKSCDGERDKYYDRMKKIEDIIRDEVKNKQEEIQAYIEAENKRKYEIKLKTIEPFINDCNEQIKQMSAPYKTFAEIEFKDEYASKSIDAITKIISDEFETTKDLHKSCTERLKYADMKSKVLKSDMDLKTEIDYMQVLGTEIYNYTVEEIDELLTNKADEIQTIEIEQEERIRKEIEAREEAKRQAEIDKIRKEQEEKERLAKIEEAKKIKEAEDKVREEERIKIREEQRKSEEAKKESFVPEKLKNVIPETSEDLEITKEEVEQEVKKVKTKDYILKFNKLTAEQANKLVIFCKENNINFEKVVM